MLDVEALGAYLNDHRTGATAAVPLHGKLSLWRALQHVADDDSRVADVDFEVLVQRAEEQGQALETRRGDLAMAAFRTD